MSDVRNNDLELEQVEELEIEPIDELPPKTPQTDNSKSDDVDQADADPSEDVQATDANTSKSVPPGKDPVSNRFLSRIRILLSKDRNELEDLASEADKIYARLDDVEATFREFGKDLAAFVKQVNKNQKYHVTDMERILERLRTDVRKQLSNAQQFHESAVTRMDTAVGAVSGVNDSLKGIRGFLDENNRVMKRFEEGYDYQILKNFVRQIARTIKNLERQIATCEEGDSKEELQDARDDMVELLERNGIRQIVPPAGGVYDGMEQSVEVSSDKVPAADPSMAGKIAEVESAGYRYEFNDGQQRVIQAARVKLYE